MNAVTKRKQSFLLRLPATLREHAAKLAQDDGTSLNHFIGIALAEKISRMEGAHLDRLTSNAHHAMRSNLPSSARL